MYPKVKPALARAWRDLHTVQFGVTPAQAVVLGPVDTATGSFLGLIDGTRGMPLLREEARAMGLRDGQADRLVGRLAAAGLIDDSTVGGPAAQEMRARTGTVERLAPDLGSLSLLRREPGGAMRALAARRALRVQVRGGGRVGAAVASVLAGAGVGRVEVLDGGLAEVSDVTPGGLPADAVGRRRTAAAHDLVTASAPGPPPRAPGPGAGRGGAGPPAVEPGLSLVVVAPRTGSPRTRRTRRVRRTGSPPASRTCTRGYWRPPAWWGRWCCPGARDARGAWSGSAWTGTGPGRGC